MATKPPLSPWQKAVDEVFGSMKTAVEEVSDSIKTAVDEVIGPLPEIVSFKKPSMKSSTTIRSSSKSLPSPYGKEFISPAPSQSFKPMTHHRSCPKCGTTLVKIALSWVCPACAMLLDIVDLFQDDR